MRRTRFMTWFFLILSLAFFCVRDFRVAMEAPLIELLPWDAWTGDFGALKTAQGFYASLDISLGLPERMLLAFGGGRLEERLYTLERYVGAEQLRHMAADAERRGDSQFMAFAALHLPLAGMSEDVTRLTEEAVAHDPNLTWLFYHVANRYVAEPAMTTQKGKILTWIDKVTIWDRENAVPYLLLAQGVQDSRGKNWPNRSKGLAPYLNGLAKEVEWGQYMAKAYASSKFDFYTVPRFELERRVLLQQKWNYPVVDAHLLTGASVGPLLPPRDYASLLVEKFGAEAEASGRRQQALDYYWSVERFGERMRLQSGNLQIQSLIALAIELVAIKRLLPALEKAGKEGEAATLNYAVEQQKKDVLGPLRDPLRQTSNRAWARFLLGLWSFLAWVFLGLTLVAVAYVNLKLWFRREKQGFVYRLMTVAENYLPVLLLVACFGLYVTYAPYGDNFDYYMTAKASSVGLSQLLENSFPSAAPILFAYPPSDIPLGRPFKGYAGPALVGVAVLVLVSLIGRWLGKREVG